VLAGASILGGAAPAAYGDELSLPTKTWRGSMAAELLQTRAEVTARPLQEGLEVWEAGASGYMVIDTTTRTPLEYSTTAVSPFHSSSGELSYLGPGLYFANRAGRSVNLFTGRSFKSSAHRVFARETAEMFHEKASPLRHTTELGKAGTGVGTHALDPVKSSDVLSRITSYSYITGCYVYPNTTGICGWVAGSIVTRYWHARSSARKLLPSKFRNGTNLTSSPNFATYLQGSNSNDSWAQPVADRLGWNAKNQNVAASWSWVLGNIGMFSEVEKNRPVIVFGSLPINTNGSWGAHAVVGYGETRGGWLITHYGWKGYTDIVLNGGLIGSNAKFQLN
jgi:hypothetical protein